MALVNHEIAGFKICKIRFLFSTFGFFQRIALTTATLYVWRPKLSTTDAKISIVLFFITVGIQARAMMRL